tara:strand:+ start:2694 stop:3473 length:780 start_codon:yes stop_codon:yes gene_type:complete
MNQEERVDEIYAKQVKDIKYLRLVRKLYLSELLMLECLPIEKLKWTDEKIHIDEILEASKDGLSRELEIQFNKQYQKRVGYIKQLEKQSPYEADSYFKHYTPKVQWCYDAHWSGRKPYRLLDDFHQWDDLPIIYIVNHQPIKDENNLEAYEVEINNVKTTIKYDVYIVMEYIRQHLKDEEIFSFNKLLRDLHQGDLGDSRLDSYFKRGFNLSNTDYQGKPNLLFAQRKELLQLMFKNLASPKGYWVCKVDYFADADDIF